ncbi:AAA family ATPase [Roseiconus nitratireducens]|uniref:AAA family ATPase n=1 Tax=Roseiconus nitratireducens TaxID=2605748 RepID=A0A5M6DB19_9BACT|nr:YhaN family protein [Roseiconus nitratireducens]KAA5543229.1 AAA family ATPase [Roseiconus nitratireducens]
MIIERLDLRAFGRFTDVSLDLSAAPHRFHLVYGPNESGKSTCLRAIESLLFGIPTRTPDSYLHANSKLRVGAKLSDHRDGPLEIIRRKNGKVKLHGADDKTPVDENLLADMLGGIDLETFRHRFGLSHAELVAGGQAVVDSKGELGEILFAAGAGVGQLKAVQLALENESKELFLERGKKKLINELIKQLDDKRKELRALQTIPAEYRELRTKLADAEKLATQADEQIADISRQLERQSACREALRIVPSWRAGKARLEELRETPDLDEDFSGRRREAMIKRDTGRQRVEQLRSKLAEVELGLDEDAVRWELIEYEQPIVSHFQNVAARQVACREQVELQGVVRNHDRHLREYLRDLQIDVPDQSNAQQIDALIERLHVSDADQVRLDELAGDYEVLRKEERDASENVQALRRQLADLDDELERIPSQRDPGQIEAVLADLGAPSALLETAEQLTRQSDELRTECTGLLAQLNLPAMALEEVVQLQLPPEAWIERHEESLSRRTRGCEDARTQRQNLQNRQREAMDQLSRLQSDLPLPTEQELEETRQLRDRAVDALETDVERLEQLPERVRAARGEIRQADRLVDRIRSHQRQVAERAAVERSLESVAAELAACEQLCESRDKELSDAEQAWQELWENCGISAQEPRAMRAWKASHESLVDRHRQLQQCGHQLTAAESRIRRAASRLVSVIEQSQVSSPVMAGGVSTERINLDEMTLEALHDHANRLRAELSEVRQNLIELKHQRERTAAELPKAEARHQTSVERREQWDRDWKDAIESFSGKVDSSPAVISKRLKKISKMFAVRRERNALIGRIESINDDNANYADQVAQLAERLGIPITASGSSEELACELHRRLMEAKSAAEHYRRLERERDELRQELRTESSTLSAADSELSMLCREAGTQQTEALPEIESRAKEKLRAAADVRQAEAQLTLIARGENLESFVERVQSQDPAELDRQIEGLQADLADLRRRREAAQRQVGGLKREVDAIDGGDRAAELNQEIQLISGRIQREAQQYAKLRIASLILRQSIDHYRREHESPVLKLACEAFRDLTCGRYVGLKPEYDDRGRSTVFGIQKEGKGESLVPVEAMSLGTADALYLAMRLASLEHQLEGGRAVPVVIDDCLIQLDDERTVAAMKRFAQLSLRTQVILFTHHRHLIELAESNLSSEEFHLHRLAV